LRPEDYSYPRDPLLSNAGLNAGKCFMHSDSIVRFTELFVISENRIQLSKIQCFQKSNAAIEDDSSDFLRSLPAQGSDAMKTCTTLIAYYCTLYAFSDTSLLEGADGQDSDGTIIPGETDVFDFNFKTPRGMCQ
jgi:hypothetical protein